jgi:hypothetical protein
VRARPDSAFRIPENAGGEPRHVELERSKGVIQEEVLLEAVAAAPIAHQLLLQRGGIEANRPSEQGIEVLERNRPRVARVNLLEGADRRRARAREADAREVGIEIEVSGHVVPRKLQRETVSLLK